MMQSIAALKVLRLLAGDGYLMAMACQAIQRPHTTDSASDRHVMHMYYSCTVEPDTTLPFPVEFVCALGVKLIGLNPLFSTGVTTAGVVGVELEVVAAAGVFVPLKLATRLPKKLPIPLPIPPNVALISGGGLVAVEGDVIGGSDAAFSFRIRSASSLSLSFEAIFVRAPSKALKREEEPVAKADDPAANALFKTSRVGARD
jgi:hypothetical protein